MGCRDVNRILHWAGFEVAGAGRMQPSTNRDKAEKGQIQLLVTCCSPPPLLCVSSLHSSVFHHSFGIACLAVHNCSEKLKPGFDFEEWMPAPPLLGPGA
jgi:hypothetical protein